MHNIKRFLLYTLILVLLSLVGCNTENEGIFKRISESVVKVDVGSIDLIMKDTGTKLYSYTNKSGLQSYDTATRDWAGIESASVYHYTNDGTNLYFAEKAAEGTNNTIYTYTLAGTPTAWAASYRVISMNPMSNLMLLRDGTDSFGVYPAATGDRGGLIQAYATQFSDSYPPQIIAANASAFIVSGVSKTDTSAYVHYYVGTLMGSSTDATGFAANPLVAMGINGTNIVAIDASGKVWKGDTGSLGNMTSSSSIAGFPTRNPKDKPYPSFTQGTKLYLQNQDNDFYAVDITNGAVSEVTDDFASTLSNITVKSFLVDGTDVYAGTMENGLFKIDMTAKTADNI